MMDPQKQEKATPPSRTPEDWEKLLPKKTSRTPEDWTRIFPRYPVDSEDGYVKSFRPDAPEEYLPILDQLGVVVIKVLPDDLCDETVEEMFVEANQMQREGAISKLSPNDPLTWVEENWPAGNKFLFDMPTVSRAAWAVRLHPNMQRVFKEIYQTNRLVSSVDKWLFARGTRNIPVLNSDTNEVETKERMAEWEQSLMLHIHLDPWRYKEVQKLARGDDNDSGFVPSIMSVVALADCPVETGGHVTLPGSTKFLDTWASERKRPEKTQYSYYVEDKIMKKYKQKIPLRKGEMVVWDLRQFHGTFSNRGPDPRVAQFVRYIPSEEWFQKLDRFSPMEVYKRWPELKTQTEQSLAALGCGEEEMCIAGLRQWDS